MDQQDQGIMTYFEADAHSFVVRVWREHGDDPKDRGEWRGWLEHVQSQGRHYFKSASEIPVIISSYLGEPVDFDDQVFLPVRANSDSK